MPPTRSELRSSRLGAGVGIRPPHYARVLSQPVAVSWFEAISENFMGLESGGQASSGPPIRMLERIRQDHPVALHGVSLSIGSTDPLRPDYLRRLKDLVDRVDPVIVSDHLCWTGVGNLNLHDLLPLPWTQESLEQVCGRVIQVQDFLQRRILLENITRYLSFEESSIPEWEFFSELTRRTGCGMLLDVNNVHVTSTHLGFDPERYLAGIPAHAVGEIHLAGFSETEAGLIDTHDHRVSPEVWSLYQYAIRRLGAVSTLIEWDDRLPDFSVLEDEARVARQIQEARNEAA